VAVHRDRSVRACATVIAGPPCSRHPHRERQIVAGDDADFFFRRRARTTVGAAELLAQFCANQLVRRAIGGACEKYFPGVTRPWIVSARASSGSPAWRARVASHAGGMQQDCIKHGIFL
jgi:hypothetical protein